MGNEGVTTLRITKELMGRCEAIAEAQRRATGELVTQADVARKFIEAGCRAAERKNRNRDE
jgi:predicted transcriptional regulator